MAALRLRHYRELPSSGEPRSICVRRVHAAGKYAFVKHANGTAALGTKFTGNTNGGFEVNLVTSLIRHNRERAAEHRFRIAEKIPGEPTRG
jgi:hypothetical protein